MRLISNRHKYLSSALLGFLWSIAACFPRSGGYVAESYPSIYYDVYGVPFPWLFFKIQSGVINIDIDYLWSLGILHHILVMRFLYAHNGQEKVLFCLWRDGCLDTNYV